MLKKQLTNSLRDAEDTRRDLVTLKTSSSRGSLTNSMSSSHLKRSYQRKTTVASRISRSKLQINFEDYAKKEHLDLDITPISME